MAAYIVLYTDATVRVVETDDALEAARALRLSRGPQTIMTDIVAVVEIFCDQIDGAA